MKCEHVISLLESNTFTSLNESDLIAIRSHCVECPDCECAFSAVQVSIVLLRERSAEGETFEPSPFFHTRVLASLRERQAANNSWAWRSMWRAAGALASSMVATVAALAVLTFVVPENQVTSGTREISSLQSSYSAEEIILSNGVSESQFPAEQVSDGQVLTTIYDGEEEAGR